MNKTVNNQQEVIKILSTTGKYTLTTAYQDLPEDHPSQETYSGYSEIPLNQANEILEHNLKRFLLILDNGGDDFFYDYSPDYIAQILALASYLNKLGTTVPYLQKYLNTWAQETCHTEDDASEFIETYGEFLRPQINKDHYSHLIIK